MTAIETLKKMLEDGTITEYDIPVGALRNEARAKKALKDLAPKEEPADKAAYMAVVDLIDRQSSIWRMYQSASEGHVGDFIDALSGDKSAAAPMPEQWQAELDNIAQQFTTELLETAYPYAVFCGDAKISSIIADKLGYVPIL